MSSLATWATLIFFSVATLAAQPIFVPLEVWAQSSGTYLNTPILRSPAAVPAEDLMEDAQDALDRGRVLEARRLLEAIIERFPHSHASDQARRALAPIYATEEQRQQHWPTSVLSPRAFAEVPQTQPRQSSGPERSAVREAATPAEQAPGLSRAQGHGVRGFDPRQLRSIIQDFRTNVADRVFFGESSAELGSRSRLVIATQALWFNRNPALLVVLEAHADDQPATREANFEIARKRAEAVRSRLIEEGIGADRIRISIRGRESPVAACSETACAAQNRRVVTLVGDPALERTMPQISGPVGR